MIGRELYGYLPLVRAALTIGVLAWGAGPGCTDGPQISRSDTPARQREHLVEVAVVEIDSLRQTSVYTGSLRSRRSVRIHTQEQGRVNALPYFEGDFVTEGAVVLELDNALLSAELEKAKAVREQARRNLERLKPLHGSRLVSDEDYLRATTAVEVAKAEEAILRIRLGHTRVTAPFEGVVSARLVEPGDVVPQHAHVLTLVDPNSLVTDLQVSELLIPHLSLNDAVSVRIDALGDRGFPGRVLRIHPELDARTRQGRVEVELMPVPAAARAGQFARVRFEVEALDRKVMPFAALRRDRDGEFVFRLSTEGEVVRTAVRSGHRQAARVEVLEGLAAGESVVVRGFLGLVDGMRVKLVASSTAGEPRTAVGPQSKG